MQEHPLNAINRLTSAQIASQGKLLIETIRIPGFDAPMLFQRDALILPTGWMQTPCDQCEAPIQFRIAKDELLAMYMPGLVTTRALVHPEFGNANVQATEAFCGACQDEWNGAVKTFYEEVEPKMKGRAR
jgi:hypothetical protein